MIGKGLRVRVRIILKVTSGLCQGYVRVMSLKHFLAWGCVSVRLGLGLYLG